MEPGGGKVQRVDIRGPRVRDETRVADMRSGRNIEIRPLGGGLGCLAMILVSIIASVVLTLVVNLVIR